MKKKHTLRASRLAFFAAALVALTAVLAAQTPAKNTITARNTARIAFGDSSKPGTLKIDLPAAELEIQGTNGNEIVITTSLDKKGAAKTDANGFRRLSNDITFELVENGNTITLKLTGDAPWAAIGAEFEIKVPRNTNLSISTRAGDEIEIDDVDGDIDINSASAGISLENIGGSVTATTANGSIEAEFKRTPAKPVSLSTTNGNITLELPPAAAADLRMRTHRGAIRTNFPETALKAEPAAAPATSAAGQVINGKLNGGGVSVQLTTMNGSITLKKDK